MYPRGVKYPQEEKFTSSLMHEIAKLKPSLNLLILLILYILKSQQTNNYMFPTYKINYILANNYSSTVYYYTMTVYLGRELLKSPDIDRALLSSVQITASNTQITGRAHHTTGQAQRVI